MYNDNRKPLLPEQSPKLLGDVRISDLPPDPVEALALNRAHLPSGLGQNLPDLDILGEAIRAGDVVERSAPARALRVDQDTTLNGVELDTVDVYRLLGSARDPGRVRPIRGIPP